MAQSLTEGIQQLAHPHDCRIGVLVFVPLNDLDNRRHRHGTWKHPQRPLTRHELGEAALDGGNP
jgi:hypothetical protein